MLPSSSPSCLQPPAPPTVRSTKRREHRPKKPPANDLPPAFATPPGYVLREGGGGADCSSPRIRSLRPQPSAPQTTPCPLPAFGGLSSSSCFDSSSTSGNPSNTSSSSITDSSSSDGDTSSCQHRRHNHHHHRRRHRQRTTRTVISPAGGSNIHLCPPLPGPLFLQMDTDTKTPLLGVRMPLGSIKPVSSPRIPPRVQWTSSSGSRAGAATPSSSGSSSIAPATTTSDTAQRSKSPPPRSVTAAPPRATVTVTPPSPVAYPVTDQSSRGLLSPGCPMKASSEERLVTPPPLVSVEAYFPSAPPPNRRVRFLPRQSQHQHQERQDEKSRGEPPLPKPDAPDAAPSPPVETAAAATVQVLVRDRKVTNQLPDRLAAINGEGKGDQGNQKTNQKANETPSDSSKTEPSKATAVKAADKGAGGGNASVGETPAPATAADTSVETVTSPDPSSTATTVVATGKPNPTSNKMTVGDSGHQKLLGALASTSKMEASVNPEQMRVIVAAQTHSSISQPSMLQQPRRTLACIFEGRRKIQKPPVLRKGTIFEDRPLTATGNRKWGSTVLDPGSLSKFGAKAGENQQPSQSSLSSKLPFVQRLDARRNSSLPNGSIQRAAATVDLNGPGVPAQRLNRLSSALPLGRSTSTLPNLSLPYTSAFREDQIRPVERFIVLDLICCACCRQPRANEYSNLIENHRLARIVTLVAVLTILGLVLTYIIRSAIEPATGATPDPFGYAAALTNATDTAIDDFLPRM